MDNKKLNLIFGGILIILFVVLICFLIFNKNSGKGDNMMEDLLGINYEISGNEAKLDNYKTENPVVAMKIGGYGSVVVELYPSVAPNTVNNFISLVKKGFYDNNSFHRLVPGFVLQGGDPSGNGTGGPDYSIKGEFSSNGFKNDLKHEKGIISMARSQDKDSAGSQFFIVLEDASNLDGEYAAFGKVIDGWDNIKRIVSNERVADPYSGQLVKNLSLDKAIVDLKGKEYPEVNKIN